METQNAAVLTYLKSGNQITPLEALHKFGCFRLAARIYELRQEGHQIEKVSIDVGKRRLVASYSLIKQA
jgi:hypothetical protein|tara:strand:- start:43 stop:249 length:207 start_codon:yes stop_codon:yes gene_type:complete